MRREQWKALGMVLCLAGCAAGEPTAADTAPSVTGPQMMMPPGTNLPPATNQPMLPAGNAGTGAPTMSRGPNTGPVAGAPVVAMPDMRAGAGAAGQGVAGSAGNPSGPAMPAPAGSADPIIPEPSGMCPDLKSGTITVMGLSGIAIASGAKPESATAPMVFYWHGTGSTSGEYVGAAGAVHQGVMAEGGVLVSFQGTLGGDLLSGTSVFGAGDFKIVDQLVACAVKERNVDPRRIFTTGCSAGGLFAGAMAAMRSNYTAAAAPNSGGWVTPVAFQNAWTPALMTIHGAMGTDVVIVDFATTSNTADKAFKQRGGFVVNCDHGGRHCGGRPLAPDIWEFFKAHPYGTKPSPWMSALPSGLNPACKIF
jgi:hypothetical protein